MAALSLYSNWPTFHQVHRHTTTVPPPPEQLSFHEDFTLSDTTSINHPLLFNSNHQYFSTTNLPVHNLPIKYPTLSSSYNTPITTQQPPSPLQLPLLDFPESPGFTHEYCSNPIVPNLCDYGEFLINSMDPRWSQQECYSYPVGLDVCSMEQVQPELPQLPEVYDGGGGGSSAVMVPPYGGGLPCNTVHGEERSVQMKEMNIGDGGRKLSTQSMAARVRRRKISEKTSQLGKLVPGGHRMTTAEMFQAAFKYIKFLQAQVGVLRLMQSSPEVGAELEALVTSSSVQEKLYAAGKCIVTQTVGKLLGTNSN